MAKKMTKAELDAYFAEVLSRYNDTPIAAYFEKDITAILESAQSGAKKSLKVAEKQEIYNNLAQMVSALDNKIVGYLGELKDNFTNDGATSTLGGTFYYRSNEGDAKANEIIAAYKIVFESTEEDPEIFIAYYKDERTPFEKYESAIEAAFEKEQRARKKKKDKKKNKKKNKKGKK